MVAGSDRPNVDQQHAGSVGRSIPRVEDAALLTRWGRYIDDLGERPGTLKVQPTPLSISCLASVRYWTTIVVLRIPSRATSP